MSAMLTTTMRAMGQTIKAIEEAGLRDKVKVQRDRTVSLEGVVYEVDAALVGETVLLRFDPAAPAGRPVQVWHQERFIGPARVVDLYANCFVKRERPSRTLSIDAPAPQPPPSPLALRQLKDGDEGGQD